MTSEVSKVVLLDQKPINIAFAHDNS